MITIKEEQFIIEHVGVPKFWISMEINNNWKQALQKNPNYNQVIAYCFILGG